MTANQGCLTQTTAGDPVTFTDCGRLLLTVTPEGELLLGPDVKARDAAAELVREFGRCYGSLLRAAEAHANAAEAISAGQKSKSYRLEGEMKGAMNRLVELREERDEWRQRAEKAEYQRDELKAQVERLLSQESKRIGQALIG